MEKLILQITENVTQEFELPEFFDFIAIEDDFGKRSISVQKNYLQKEGWIERTTVKNVLNDLQKLVKQKKGIDLAYFNYIEEKKRCLGLDNK